MTRSFWSSDSSQFQKHKMAQQLLISVSLYNANRHRWQKLAIVVLVNARFKPAQMTFECTIKQVICT